MRTFIFGGSFNPVHNGHLYIIREVFRELGYERAILVPANIASHKENLTKLTPEDRLMMLRAAAEEIPDCIVEDCDIRRGGVTYSIDTVSYILGKYDITGKPGFIIGDDLLPAFNTWREPDRLKELVELIVVRRDMEEMYESEYPDRYIMNRRYTLSSTEIRERVRQGLSIENMVPEKVRELIERNRFYR